MKVAAAVCSFLIQLYHQQTSKEFCMHSMPKEVCDIACASNRLQRGQRVVLESVQVYSLDGFVYHISPYICVYGYLQGKRI